MRKDKLRDRASKRQSPRLGIENLESRSMLTTCTDLCGDANLDGNVDFDDFLALSANFNTEGDWSKGDFNGDDKIDFPDFLILADNFGNSIGAASRMSDQTVLEAAKLIKEGKTYSLAHILGNDSPGNPFVGHDSNLDTILGPFGTTETVALVETVQSNFMHAGTQFDALGHIGIGDQYYNGNTFDDVFSPTGLKKLGAEEVPPFFTRGVLVDIARYKHIEGGMDDNDDVRPLDGGYEITLDDLNGALEMQETEIRPGDVVLFHTGWGSHYTSNPELFAQTQPGIGLEVARSLANREVVMVGADNVFVDVFPNPDPNLFFPVHQELLTKEGIYLLEIVKTDELAKDKVYEFAFSFAPIRVEGATGSAAHPFAII